MELTTVRRIVATSARDCFFPRSEDRVYFMRERCDKKPVDGMGLEKMSLVFVGFMMLVSCTGNPDMKIGVGDGALSPCPTSPNCVSTQSADERHRIEPLEYSGSQSEAKAKLLVVIRSMKRAAIVEDNGGYLHVTFTSALFRFVDDVEFYFPGGEQIIQARSASRAGYYDFGVNRKRIERIRSLFHLLQR